MEHLSNLPPHCDNATHQGISISQPCYEEECLEWTWSKHMSGDSFDNDFLLISNDHD